MEVGLECHKLDTGEGGLTLVRGQGLEGFPSHLIIHTACLPQAQQAQESYNLLRGHLEAFSSRKSEMEAVIASLQRELAEEKVRAATATQLEVLVAGLKSELEAAAGREVGDRAAGGKGKDPGSGWGWDDDDNDGAEAEAPEALRQALEEARAEASALRTRIRALSPTTSLSGAAPSQAAAVLELRNQEAAAGAASQISPRVLGVSEVQIAHVEVGGASEEGQLADPHHISLTAGVIRGTAESSGTAVAATGLTLSEAEAGRLAQMVEDLTRDLTEAHSLMAAQAEQIRTASQGGGHGEGGKGGGGREEVTKPEAIEPQLRSEISTLERTVAVLTQELSDHRSQPPLEHRLSADGGRASPAPPSAAVEELQEALEVARGREEDLRGRVEELKQALDRTHRAAGAGGTAYVQDLEEQVEKLQRQLEQQQQQVEQQQQQLEQQQQQGLASMGSLGAPLPYGGELGDTLSMRGTSSSGGGLAPPLPSDLAGDAGEMAMLQRQRQSLEAERQALKLQVRPQMP